LGRFGLTGVAVIAEAGVFVVAAVAVAFRDLNDAIAASPRARRSLIHSAGAAIAPDWPSLAGGETMPTKRPSVSKIRPISSSLRRSIG
jgi:hypothetical protein